MIGAESRPGCGRSFPLKATAALGRRDGLGEQRGEQRALPLTQAAARSSAGSEPGVGVCAYAQLAFLCEKTLQLFVENPPEAEDTVLL